jgi:hypothetical protein
LVTTGRKTEVISHWLQVKTIINLQTLSPDFPKYFPHRAHSFSSLKEQQILQEYFPFPDLLRTGQVLAAMAIVRYFNKMI